MKRIYLICGLALFLGISVGISYFLIRDASAKIPGNITLMNQDNQQVTLRKDHTKFKLIEFIYTHCPDICPTTTQKMKILQKDLQKKGVYGKEIEFITITIDPYRDTPSTLKNYMRGFGIKDDGSWIFLTGNPYNIKQEQSKVREVANALQFQYKDPGNGQFIHSTFTYLVDQNNKFITKFPMGQEFKEQEVYKTILEKMK